MRVAPLVIPLLSFCEKALPFLSVSLVGEESQRKIVTFCSCLPSHWNTSQIGFEAVLSNQENWGDFHLLLDWKEREKQVVFEDSSWTFLTRLLNHWFASRFWAEQSIGRTILELDIGSSSLWPPIPNLCLVFTSHTDPLAVMRRILPFLSSKTAANSPFIGAIHRILAAGGWIDGLGLMFARSPRLRILFRMSVNKTDVLAHLFPQQFRIVDALLKAIAIFSTDWLVFEVDVNEEGEISPRIGLNIPSQGDSISTEQLVQTLHLHHWLSSEKKQALLSWIGTHENSSFNRDIHHVKFVGTPHREILVKAYLSCRLNEKIDESGN